MRFVQCLQLFQVLFAPEKENGTGFRPPRRRPKCLASAPGETLRLTLYWRALATMDTSYTVFTHLLDGANQVRGQQDNVPVNGTYPTTLWAPGEVIVDRYAITVDADAAPGRHAIEVGLYVAETGQRLPLLDAGGQVVGDRILVAEVDIE